MSSPDDGTLDAGSAARGAVIARLLIVADAAVAEVNELPAQVRAQIDAATEVYVVTPSLSGRLAWLASELKGHRGHQRSDLATLRARPLSRRRPMSSSATSLSRDPWNVVRISPDRQQAKRTTSAA